MNKALEAFAKIFTPPVDFAGGGDGAHSRLAIPSLTGCADAFLALTLATRETPRLVLAVTPGIPEADRLADDLRLLAAKPDSPRDGKASAYATRILEFPALVSNDRTSLGTRIKTLAAIKAWEMNPYPCVVVAAFPALSTPIPRATPDSIVLAVRTEDATIPQSFSNLIEKISSLGYHRTPQVEQEGDFSVRGGILDAWSPGDDFPVRAEFFGDGLESLRAFNPATQVSIERIEKCELLPIVGERGEIRDEGERGEGGMSLFDQLPNGSAVIALEHNEYTLQPPTFDILYSGDPPPANTPTYGFQTSPLPGFAELGADEAHHPELFEAARARLEQHLAAAKKREATVVQLDDLSGGFEIECKTSTLQQHSLIVVTKADRVFTKKQTHYRTNAAIAQGPRLNDFDDLEPGEYVVHVDYGVGRFIGSSEILMDGRRSEVFTIEYADGGKLHVPSSHAHLLSRYVGVKGEAVRLHRLDGKRWTKDKQAAQKAVTDLAAALLETQARRETVPGFAYDAECDGLEAFEAAFPYEETPDQTAAIAAIKKDLGARKPMDRLICGDAGYGKTEVAMRAAFIAAMNGKQVAVLAPTTVLAEQHFETFTSRFDGTPVRIESVSRFQTSGTHEGTFKRLAAGVCDIVIGTHAILSSKIAFHDLGLIVIDEEQRFGVRHKEFLKRLRATADVLTLSATPIPRTLYLSMTGARDLSLLRSPPRERVAVETKIVRDSDETIRSAIEAELIRGGQVFFLHNRVQDIGRVEKRLTSILQSATSCSAAEARRMPRIVVAHGQMDARTLAVKMRDFERGAYDILLSTTIIESGIDIPRANTIIVDRAENFGMADLYQLRGRVGRSSRQGHAIFLLPASGDIDSDARERLTALKRHGGLGAGFNLAVRDLELRGAGNLLGSQQSGHIAAIGFSLYCQLLKRTIAKMKGERVKDIVDVQLNLDFATGRIPFSYVEEDSQRLSLLKRFAEAPDERAIRELVGEMKDRFGPLPPETEEFVQIARLRAVCAACGITNVDVKDTRAVFYKVGSRSVAFVETLRASTVPAKLRELLRIARTEGITKQSARP